MSNNQEIEHATEDQTKRLLSNIQEEKVDCQNDGQDEIIYQRQNLDLSSFPFSHPRVFSQMLLSLDNRSLLSLRLVCSTWLRWINTCRVWSKVLPLRLESARWEVGDDTVGKMLLERLEELPRDTEEECRQLCFRVDRVAGEIMDQGAPITWQDIKGLEIEKKMVKKNVVWPMLKPYLFTATLLRHPKNLLLFGPPGTGKTLIGKCIASQFGSKFFSISASTLMSKWVGGEEGEKIVRALFAVAKVNQPSVVFIDDIDSLLSSGSVNEEESSIRIRTEFLVQLRDTWSEGGERVLVVGATNRPQELDEAAREKLVKRIYIGLPEAEARIQIINNLLAKESHEVSEKEVEEVGRQTEGYSGADMANLCKEAALGPIRSLPFGPDQVRPINFKDLQNALRQVKASVSEQDLDLYLDWDRKFGKPF